MFKRKQLFLSVLVVLMLALGACGGGRNAPAAEAPAEEAPAAQEEAAPLADEAEAEPRKSLRNRRKRRQKRPPSSLPKNPRKRLLKRYRPKQAPSSPAGTLS
jgi:hypothetical protein